MLELGLIDCIKISLRYAARALRLVKGVKKTFFCIFMVSEHFESFEIHFFFEIFCEREAQNAR